MLDKRTSRFLAIVSRICSDGSYKIIEKTELSKEMRERTTDFVSLGQMVQYLQDNEMIDVKYTDETVYCLTVLPKGRAAFENTRNRSRDAIKISQKTMIILIAGCFVAALIGSMLGTLLAHWM